MFLKVCSGYFNHRRFPSIKLMLAPSFWCGSGTVADMHNDDLGCVGALIVLHCSIGFKETCHFLHASN
uniref:Uncharacterized protein n=1 Tax=Arundo donax TaxID=35708 RepID=A0A0A9T5C2_ARUDO